MQILVIDDKFKERERGRAAVEARGWECLTFNPTFNPTNREEGSWVALAAEVDAVITDLMWSRYDQGEQPAGLLVVIHSLFLGKPVVVCTDVGEYENGHHGPAISFIHDAYLTKCFLSDKSKAPFGWEERKNWDEAVEKLAKRLEV